MSNIRFLSWPWRKPPTDLDLHLAEGKLIDQADLFFLLQCRNHANQSTRAEMRARIDDVIRRVEAAKARERERADDTDNNADRRHAAPVQQLTGLERIPFRVTRSRP